MDLKPLQVIRRTLPSAVMLRKTWRELWRHKVALLVLGAIMAIGIGSYVGMSTVHRDMDTARADYYAEYRLADFTVDLKRIPSGALDTIADLPNVRAVQGRVNTAVRVDLPGADVPIAGQALSLPFPRRPVYNDVLLRRGTWFSADNGQVIIDRAFADAYGLRPGDSLPVLLPNGQYDLLIVGLAESPEFVFVIPPGGSFAPDPSRYAIMYLPERFLQQTAGLDGAYNQIVGMAHNNDEPAVERMLALARRRLDPYGVIGTTPWQQQISVAYLHDELAGLKVSATIVPVIFLGVAALILNILLGRIIQQERTTIGTLKALGYSHPRILVHYLSFGVAVSLAGTIPGLIFGRWMQVQMVELYKQFYALPDVQAAWYADRLLLGAGISLFFALLGTTRPVLRAVWLPPAEAMRAPPPERAHKILAERIGVFWHNISFTSKIVLRSIFRNPVRSGAAVLAGILATAIVLITFTLRASLDYMMDFEMNRVAQQDMLVGLRDPRGITAQREVAGLPGVVRTEGRLSVACELSRGVYREQIALIALPANPQLYRPLDRSAQPVPLPEKGLLLSQSLAEKLRLQPGDVIRLRPLIGARREVVAPVVGTVDALLGQPAYARIDYLSRLLGEAWVANEVLLDVDETQSRRSRDALLNALGRRPQVVGVSERERQLRRLDETFGETMDTILFIEVLFAGLLAFGSLLNNSLVVLSERRREIGTMRVMGYRPGRIARMFATENFLLGSAGILMGLPVGIWMTHFLATQYSTDNYRFRAKIEAGDLLETIGIMLVFVALAQLIVTLRMWRSDWLESLKMRE